MEVCDSFLKKFRGLMFSKPKNLYFILSKETRINATVHTCFVFFPINVYWLDKDKNIVDFCLSLKPFRFKVPRKKAKYIIELKKDYFLDNPLKPSITTKPPSIQLM